MLTIMALILPITVFAIALILASIMFRKLTPTTAGWFVAGAFSAMISAYAHFLYSFFDNLFAFKIVGHVFGAAFIILTIIACYQTYAKTVNGTLEKDQKK